MGVLTNCGLEVSQGGSKQEDREKGQQEGPKRPMPHFGPQTLGRQWAQEAPKWAPRGAQAGAPQLQQGYKTQWWILTISGFEASQGGTQQQDHEEEQQAVSYTHLRAHETLR